MSTLGQIEIVRRPGCPSCGAVLSLPVSGEYVRCPQCLQQLRIPSQQDRPVESLPCVACSGRMLAYACGQGELIIDFCSSCEGFWFDGGELQRLVQEPALLDTFQLPPHGRHSRPDLPSHWRNCPRCTGQKLSSTRLGDVTLDVCLQCRGSWLDAGELQRLSELHRASPEPEPKAREHWLRQWVSQALRLLGSKS